MLLDVSRRGRRKLPGRFCWCCGRRRPNESFTRRGVCRDCVKLGREEIAYRQHVRNIDRLLTWDGLVRPTQRRTFEKYLQHPDARVRAYAEGVKAMEEERRQERREMWAAIRADEEAWAEVGPFWCDERMAIVAESEPHAAVFEVGDDLDEIPF